MMLVMQTKTLTTSQRKANIEFDCRWKEVRGGDWQTFTYQLTISEFYETSNKQKA